jgi:predicted esterase
MKNALRTLVLSLVIVARAHGAEVVRLEPNAILRFDFPDLPATLATQNTGEKQPACLTARLPENYSRDGGFPLCVYLDGGDGGGGNRPGIARAIVGSTNFICVNLPLFKRAYNTNDGLLVSLDDFATVSSAYHTMLQKLLDTVPNVTVARSVFGGFSNGAHTTALLVAGQDEFILQHFQGFYMVEGGAFLAENALHRNSLRHCRFLFLHGDYAGGSPDAEAQGFLLLGRAIEYYAKKQNLDFTSVVMRNTGHDFPPKYMALAGEWIRGGKLPSTNQKE